MDEEKPYTAAGYMKKYAHLFYPEPAFEHYLQENRLEPRDEEERRHLYHAFYQGWHAHAHAHQLRHPTERHDGWLMLR